MIQKGMHNFALLLILMLGEQMVGVRRKVDYRYLHDADNFCHINTLPTWFSYRYL